jgi:SNF family Na+-dependent transporter
MADQVHISRDAPGPADKATSEQAHQFGLTAAMALIVGSIIGVGIFNLPTWYSRNTGHGFWVYWAPFFLAVGALALGIPVYLGQRRHMTQPASVPPFQ